MSETNPTTKDGRVEYRRSERMISCDQVAWLMAVFDRYLPRDVDFPAVSKQREMKKYALLYEVMDTACLEFKDRAALCNGTPPLLTRRLSDFAVASELEEEI